MGELEALASPPLRRRCFHVKNPVVRAIGWIVLFRCLGFPGVMAVFAWGHWRAGRRSQAGWLFGLAAVIALLGNALVFYLRASLGGEDAVWLQIGGWAPLIPGIITGAITFIISLPVGWIWQRLLEAPPAETQDARVDARL